MYSDYMTGKSAMINIEFHCLARRFMSWRASPGGARFVRGMIVRLRRHGAKRRPLDRHDRAKDRPDVRYFALLTVLSGIYLFAVLHPNDSSPGAGPETGAIAALLSLAVGFVVARRPDSSGELNQRSLAAPRLPEYCSKFRLGRRTG